MTPTLKEWHIFIAALFTLIDGSSGFPTNINMPGPISGEVYLNSQQDGIHYYDHNARTADHQTRDESHRAWESADSSAVQAVNHATDTSRLIQRHLRRTPFIPSKPRFPPRHLQLTKTLATPDDQQAQTEIQSHKTKQSIKTPSELSQISQPSTGQTNETQEIIIKNLEKTKSEDIFKGLMVDDSTTNTKDSLNILMPTRRKEEEAMKELNVNIKDGSAIPLDKINSHNGTAVVAVEKSIKGEDIRSSNDELIVFKTTDQAAQISSQFSQIDQEEQKKQSQKLTEGLEKESISGNTGTEITNEDTESGSKLEVGFKQSIIDRKNNERNVTEQDPSRGASVEKHEEEVGNNTEDNKGNAGAAKENVPKIAESEEMLVPFKDVELGKGLRKIKEGEGDKQSEQTEGRAHIHSGEDKVQVEVEQVIRAAMKEPTAFKMGIHTDDTIHEHQDKQETRYEEPSRPLRLGGHDLIDYTHLQMLQGYYPATSTLSGLSQNPRSMFNPAETDTHQMPVPSPIIYKPHSPSLALASSIRFGPPQTPINSGYRSLPDSARQEPSISADTTSLREAKMFFAARSRQQDNKPAPALSQQPEDDRHFRNGMVYPLLRYPQMPYAVWSTQPMSYSPGFTMFMIPAQSQTKPVFIK